MHRCIPIRHRTGSKPSVGMALIIVLAMTALISGLLLTFFGKVRSERQVSNSYTHITIADHLAKTGLNYVLKALRSEMIAGSNAVGTPPVYIPKTGISRKNLTLLPARSAAPPPDKVPNVLKQSAYQQPFYPNTSEYDANAPNPASQVSTDTPSANRRTVSPSRWNASYLIPKLSTKGDSPEPVSDFKAPDWIMITRAGIAAKTDADLPHMKDERDDDFAIGRFAYVVFDQSGLLDMNLAGFPSLMRKRVLSDPDKIAYRHIGGKRSLAMCDLFILRPTSTQTPGTTSKLDQNFFSSAPRQSTVDKIIGWRNYATAEATGSFPGFSFSSADAFLFHELNENNHSRTVPEKIFKNQTDQRILSRYQLIQLRRSMGFSINALQYMTHFTRTTDAPSWGPRQNASDMGGHDSGGFDYANLAQNPTATHPLLPLVRIKSTSPNSIIDYDAQGQSYHVPREQNSPLIARRFDLKRLSWIGKDGPVKPPSSNSSDFEFEKAILSCFGLVWMSGAREWKYVSGGGSSSSSPVSAIKTLHQVASEKRNADFFELLQAGILRGSLGMQPGVDAAQINQPIGTKIEPAQDNSTFRHIIQIGANIIDQFDPDSFPVRIRTSGPIPVSGNENIPYLYRLAFTTFFPGDIATDSVFNSWLEPILWNPCQGAASDAPASYRIRLISGSLHGQIRSPSKLYDCTPACDGSNGVMQIEIKNAGPPLSTDTENPRLLSELIGDGYPVAITQSLSGTHVGTRGRFVQGSTDYAGFWLGEVDCGTDSAVSTVGIKTGGTPLIFVYEANYGSSTSPDYREIQRFYIGKGIESIRPAVTGSPPRDLYFLPDRRPYYLGRIDPRTSRFGISTYLAPDYTGNGDKAKHMAYAGHTDWWQGTNTSYRQSNLPTSSDDLTLTTTGSPPYPYYRIADNQSDAPVHYSDTDGVRRDADGWWNNNKANTLPLANTISYRPVILNRPIRNVAELGYTFRDIPWKSLDFTSKHSADRGLLELFTVQNPCVTSNVVAGRLNPNTPHYTVLATMLSLVHTGGSGETYLESDAQANRIAQSLVASTQGSDGPVTDVAELASRVLDDSAVAAVTDHIKMREELIPRALSEVAQTRTWNLLIDVVAQSGLYPPSADSLDDFIVQGEKRYWLHIAIDRYTGEVIDRQLEPVLE